MATLVLMLAVSAFAGWVVGDIRGWRKGWKEGMEIADSWERLFRKVISGQHDQWVMADKRKDLPS